MAANSFPENVRDLKEDESFAFACHPGVPCFNECCRELELALTPYDALRLRRELQMNTSDFLEQYALVEFEEGDVFPRVYLGMVDDGRASCPFVSKEGCSVYQGRPGPCRTYPLGRAAYKDQNGEVATFHVLIHEDHCQGFNESEQQTIASWTTGQGLQDFNQLNDAMMTILHHPELKKGFTSTKEQRNLYLASLYDLDHFRTLDHVVNSDQLSDEELLLAAINWLRIQLYGFFTF